MFSLSFKKSNIIPEARQFWSLPSFSFLSFCFSKNSLEKFVLLRQEYWIFWCYSTRIQISSILDHYFVIHYINLTQLTALHFPLPSLTDSELVNKGFNLLFMPLLDNHRPKLKLKLALEIDLFRSQLFLVQQDWCWFNLLYWAGSYYYTKGEDRQTWTTIRILKASFRQILPPIVQRALIT